MSATNNPIELLIALGVNDSTSKSNINTYINNLKGLDLAKIILGVDDTSSRTNINTYIKQLTNLEKVKVQLEVDGTSTSSNQIKDLENQIKSLKRQIDTISSGKGLHNVSEDFSKVSKSASDTGKALDGLGNRNYDKPFVKLQTDAIKTMSSFEELEQYFLKHQIKFKYDKNSKDQITKITASLKDEFGKLENVIIKPKVQMDLSGVKNVNFGDIANVKSSTTDTSTHKLNENVNSALNQLDKLAAKGKLTADKFDEFWHRITNAKTNNSISTIVNEMSMLNTSTTHADKFKNKIDEISNTLKNLSWNGQMTSTEIEKFKTKLKNIPLNDLVRAKEVMSELSVATSNASKANKVSDAIKNQQNQYSRLNSELEKTVNLYRKSVDMADVGAVQKMINSFGSTKVNNGADISKMAAQYSMIREEIKRINAEATVATRNSMGFIDSFKQALSKVPVWMAATTVFYSSVRSAKEFMDIIVDVDTKLVSIAKVASEDMKISDVLDRATQSANEFGQSISQALDAYIEFARQGYKGEDLANLADVGLIAANVGEITAQQASEYVTSSLVQWKKETSEANGIIDSWNALSNNYATTFEKIAIGQTRAGATAKSMGLDFNQLNAIIGSVTASTKQSGKFHCPI